MPFSRACHSPSLVGGGGGRRGSGPGGGCCTGSTTAHAHARVHPHAQAQAHAHACSEFSGCRRRSERRSVNVTNFRRRKTTSDSVSVDAIPLRVSTILLAPGRSGRQESAASYLSCTSCRQSRTHHDRRVLKRTARRRSHELEQQQQGYARWCDNESTRKRALYEKRSPRTVMFSYPGPRTEMASVTEKLKRNPLLGFFQGSSNVFRADDLGTEIGIIALPALFALAAEPVASLVDTGFIGRVGPVELAAVGVAISVFNLVSKMFNMPLLNITTSLVAEDEASGKVSEAFSAVTQPMMGSRESLIAGDETEEIIPGSDIYVPQNEKPLLPSVSSALALGTALGLIEAAVMAFGAGPILTVMGVGAGSSMRTPAIQYLALRAVGAPAVVVALAIQGVFRGFKDTKTPLFATVLGNVVNVVLDPILIFTLHFGVGGAAAATVISQYVIALVLLWVLSKRVTMLPPRLSDLRFDKYLKSGGLLLGRTLAILLTMTLATSMAARQGPLPMAAHQICMQIWLAASLLSDSLALAGQAIIASAFAKKNYKEVKRASFRILQMGLALGFLMALILAVGCGSFTTLFTKDPGVLQAMTLIIPFVVATQPINSLAFVFDGIHYGLSDFSYAAASMIVVAVPSCVVLLLASPLYALPGVWLGLTVVMTLRMFAGFLRIGSCTGPWEFFLKETEEDDAELGELQGDVDVDENPPTCNSEPAAQANVSSSAVHLK